MKLQILLILMQMTCGTLGFDCKRCSDANSCDTITGNFRVTEMSKGYHPVLTVPRGACNINVTELGNTNNVLALKDVYQDSYIFNGQWLMDDSGNYRAVGVIFSYNTDNEFCPGECIRATGPTLGPVVIQLLYHERNPGVSFRYQLPKNIKDLPDYNSATDDERGELRETPNDYEEIPGQKGRKRIGSFPKLVPIPGPSGIHHRGPIFSSDFKYRRQNARARTNSMTGGDRQSLTDMTFSRGLDEDSARLETVNPNEKHELLELTRVAKDNTLEGFDGSGDSVPFVGDQYTWTLSHHTNCSRPCGGGIKMEVYQCSSLAQNQVVEDVYCNAIQKPEIHHLVCNAEPCTPQWVTGKWSECSVSCGQGSKSRDVTCKQRISAIDAQELDESYCGSRKPASRMFCYAESCFSWFLGNWSECSEQCGKGHKSRTVQCTDKLNNNVNNSLCGYPIPASKKECGDHSCTSVWYHTQWFGKCSADCGGGVITRKVQCATGNGLVLPNENCDSSKKPPTEKQCQADTKCGGRWFTGPWTECSEACGKGKMTRQVVCIKYAGNNVTITDDSGCHVDEKPGKEKECTSMDCENTWYRTEWSKCSKSCNGGTRTRSVHCMGQNFQLSSYCNPLDKPDEHQACNTEKCRKRRPNRKARCSDRYPNCNVVVQAKLCRYPYYQRKCCKSCSGLKRLY